MREEPVVIESIEGRIVKNSSLYLSMKQNGIPSRMINEITSALGSVFHLGHSQPGDVYCLDYTPPDTLVRFEYKSRDIEKYIILPKDDSMVAMKVYRDLNRFYRGVHGRVEGSLWDTLVKMGEEPVLINKLADIFGWEIDFLTDIREGDEFDFVVEGFEEDGKTVFYGDILVARFVCGGEEHYAVLFEDHDGNRDYFDLQGNSLMKTLVKSPLNYRRVTSRFSKSRLHPILKIRRPHYGIDYAAAVGTPVVSAGDGRVIFKGWMGEYGNSIVIRHAHGYQTSYGHLSRFAVGVNKGDRVKQNEVIGFVGTTGLSTGPHLDYRIKKDGKFVDPLRIELPRAKPVPDEYRNEFLSIRDEMLLTLRAVIYEEPTKVYVAKPGDAAPTHFASTIDMRGSP